MKKTMLCFTLALTIANGAFADEEPFDGISGDWAAETVEGLLGDVIYKGAQVKTSDLLAKATYQMEISSPEFPDFKHPGCTATLIARDVVLTAAHCLADLDTKKIVVSIKSAPDANGVSRRVKVSKIKIHERYTKKRIARIGDVNGHDIALLRLEKAMPGGVAALLPKSDLWWEGARKTVVAGFGSNALPEKTAEDMKKDPRVIALMEEARKNPKMTTEEGTALIAKIMSIMAERPLLTTDLQGSLENSRGSLDNLPRLILRGKKLVCSGDSGGPTYLRQTNGKLVVIGVHSTSTNAACKPQTDGQSEDTFVPFYLDWIQGAMKDLRSETAT